MKNDRELLELAAKAAGLTVKYTDSVAITGKVFQLFFDGDHQVDWHPLENDGDALRLAVKLGFTVEPGACWHSPYGSAFGEDVLYGVMTATRRAIVRAAAAIGEAMQ